MAFFLFLHLGKAELKGKLSILRGEKKNMGMLQRPLSM